MGISPPIGLGFFLLFTVSFFSGEADLEYDQKLLEFERVKNRLQGYNSITSEQEPIAFYAAKLGEASNFLLSALPGKSWTVTKFSPNLQIGAIESLHPSEHSLIPDLFGLSVKPTKTGIQIFELTLKNNDDPSEAEVIVSVRLTVTNTAAQNSAAVQRNIYLRIFLSTKTDHYYLAGQDVFTIDIPVGTKVTFLTDGKETFEDGSPTGSKWNNNRGMSSEHLRISPVKKLWSSGNDYVPDLFVYEAVATEEGDHLFQPTQSTPTGTITKTVTVRAVLRSIVFVGGDGYDTRRVVTAVNSKVAFYAIYRENDAGWSVNRRSTSPSLRFTRLEINHDFDRVNGYDHPMKRFEVTPTRLGIFNLELEYNWLRGGDVPDKETRSIQIVAE